METTQEYFMLSSTNPESKTQNKLFCHLLPISQIFQVRRIRHAGHCWKNKDELISDVLLRTPAYGRAIVGPAALRGHRM